MVIEESDPQPSNAERGMLDAPDGHVIAVMLVYAKAADPTLLTLAIPVTAVSEEQWSNARVGIAVASGGTKKVPLYVHVHGPHHGSQPAQLEGQSTAEGGGGEVGEGGGGEGGGDTTRLP